MPSPDETSGKTDKFIALQSYRQPQNNKISLRFFEARSDIVYSQIRRQILQCRQRNFIAFVSPYNTSCNIGAFNEPGQFNQDLRSIFRNQLGHDGPRECSKWIWTTDKYQRPASCGFGFQRSNSRQRPRWRNDESGRNFESFFRKKLARCSRTEGPTLPKSRNRILSWFFSSHHQSDHHLKP